MTVSSSKLSY